ncbi:hypothetical protein NQ318_016654 [Aromia moschata]|uniref:Peptidase aspartic putative domain-containing protein n=1 Tax=Aromia moschata TaxID=1265417 RepID=A0AAV8X0W6_9CUCU|nr:hypothetical protein NQ318_016654 [Aromia moschata]
MHGFGDLRGLLPGKLVDPVHSLSQVLHKFWQRSFLIFFYWMANVSRDIALRATGGRDTDDASGITPKDSTFTDNKAAGIRTASTNGYQRTEDKLEKIELVWDQFSNIQSDIEILDDSDAQRKEGEFFEEQYFSVVSKAKELLAEFQETKTNANTDQSVNYSRKNVHLPTLTLPKFHGQYEGWQSFHDAFEALVNRDKSLSNTQKFMYLNSCLEGEAASITESLIVTDDNYVIAWDLLRNRYENKRAILNAHVNALLDLPSTQLRVIRVNNLQIPYRKQSRLVKQINWIRIRNDQSTHIAQFHVNHKITQNIPTVSFDLSKLDIPSDITLADPDFSKSAPIDVLLGAEIFFDILCVGQIKLGLNKPILQKSHVGWIVSGPVFPDNFNNVKLNCNLSVEGNIHDCLEKFWQIEECPGQRCFTTDEMKCEDDFVANMKRSEAGRFIVSLPKRANCGNLGESLEQATNRVSRDIALRATGGRDTDDASGITPKDSTFTDNKVLDASLAALNSKAATSASLIVVCLPSRKACCISMGAFRDGQRLSS